MAASTFIIDNGAYTAKCGFKNQNDPRIIPNCITKAKSERRRQFIGDQIDDCKDFSGIFYILPFQKGYIVNWDVQKTVWDFILGRDVFNVNFTETNCIVTEPYFNFASIQENMTEIFFEEYGFESLLRINGGTLSAYLNSQEEQQLCCLLVDSGYSFTHIVPYCKGKKIPVGIRRLDVGGKLLTNHLKEIISYRQLHVMDETYVMNQVKEDVCYVAQDYYSEMEAARVKTKGDDVIARDYVLPDYSVIKRGYTRPLEETTGKSSSGEQIIRMNNERFSVPEVLFHPSDIGIQQMGIPEAIIHSIQSTPPAMHPHLYKNIVLTGGNALFPGFKDRMYKEVRSMAPAEFDVNIILPSNPITYSWKGGVALAKSQEFNKLAVTRRQYEEDGYECCEQKFDV